MNKIHCRQAQRYGVADGERGDNAEKALMNTRRSIPLRTNGERRIEKEQHQ